MTTWRLTIAIVMVASAAVLGWQGENRATAIPAPAVLDIPYQVSDWAGADAEPLDPEVAREIAADRILNRDYVSRSGDQAALYVAYYERQRPGVSIHSPLNCLPGTGWNVLTNETVDVNVAGRAGAIRRLVAQKDASRVVILYWYAIHGRMIASDLTSRLQLFSDRLTSGRNDAALVRLVIPSQGSDADADAAGRSFVTAITPYL